MSLKIAGVPMEIVQTQDRVIKTVRLFPPPRAASSPKPRKPCRCHGTASRRRLFCHWPAAQNYVLTSSDYGKILRLYKTPWSLHHLGLHARAVAEGRINPGPACKAMTRVHE